MKNIVKNLKLFLFNNKPFIAVLAFAFLLRIWGINYGLPLTFNMDERSFVNSVSGLRFSLNPNRFDWPHTHMYISFVFFMLFYYFRVSLQLLNLKNIIQPLLPFLWEDPSVFFLLARIISVVFSTLTLIPLYLSSKLLFKSKNWALVSVVILSVIPFAIFDTHLATLDTPMTFWVSMFLYFTLKIIDTPNRKNFVLSGLFMGLAFGSKYNAFFYYIVFAFSLYYSLNKNQTLLKKLFYFFSPVYIKNLLSHLGAFLVAYLITNPTVITNFKLFWSFEYGRGFLFQFKNVSSLKISEYPQGLADIFYNQLPNDLGIFLYFLVVIGLLLYLFFNYRNKITNLTAFFILFIFFYMSTKSRHPSHYFVFLYPLIAVFATKLFYDIHLFLESKIKKLSKYVTVLFMTLVLLPSIYQSLLYDYKYSNEDNRLLMFKYIEKNLEKGQTLYTYGSDLDQLKFANINEISLNRADVSLVDTNKLPFYFLIADKFVTKEELLAGKRDTRYIKGNEGRILLGSDLITYFDNSYTWGPKIYLFKTNYVKPGR